MTSSLFDSFSLYIGHLPPADTAGPSSEHRVAAAEPTEAERIDFSAHPSVKLIHTEHATPSHHFAD